MIIYYSIIVFIFISLILIYVKPKKEKPTEDDSTELIENHLFGESNSD